MLYQTSSPRSGRKIASPRRKPGGLRVDGTFSPRRGRKKTMHMLYEAKRSSAIGMTHCTSTSDGDS